MQTVCPRCNHQWDYKGKAWFITCPVCRKMIKNVHREVEVKTVPPMERMP